MRTRGRVQENDRSDDSTTASGTTVIWDLGEVVVVSGDSVWGWIIGRGLATGELEAGARANPVAPLCSGACDSCTFGAWVIFGVSSFSFWGRPGIVFPQASGAIYGYSGGKIYRPLPALLQLAVLLQIIMTLKLVCVCQPKPWKSVFHHCPPATILSILLLLHYDGPIKHASFLLKHNPADQGQNPGWHWESADTWFHDDRADALGSPTSTS